LLPCYPPPATRQDGRQEGRTRHGHHPPERQLAAETLAGSDAADLIYGAAPALVSSATPAFSTVATGLGALVFATAAPGDATTLHLVDRTGVVRALDLATGTARTVLNIAAQVESGGEQGLLGLAFHPDFALNRKLYVFVSLDDGDRIAPQVLREYVMAADGMVDVATARDLLTVPQTPYDNHKGGWIGFGPDGMLHIATGDGGGGGDPLRTGQDPNDLLGSILRIDVDADGFPADPTRNYAIPADNPFVASGGAPEVWAYGLRNPWRDSFERGTGTLWIADVGQGRREEVSLGTAGGNHGWSL